MNVPNVLTVIRIFLTFIFLSLIHKEGLAFKIEASVVFGAAALTDFFDGYYARKHNLITTFGKIMDPIADKFLILATFYVFTQMQFIPIWMFMVIAVRELLITGLRFIAMKYGTVLAADQMGKIKTVLQIAAIIFFLIYLILVELAVKTQILNAYVLRVYFGGYILMYAVVIITVSSGAIFLWNNQKEFFRK